MKQKKHNIKDRRSIFRSLFVPLFLIMVLQSAIFFFAAVYGGIEESLSQNASDILSERLTNRTNEIETRFNGKWSNLDDCITALNDSYSEYEQLHGDTALALDQQLQIDFLSDNSELLISTLRQNEVNGIFLILNDKTDSTGFALSGSEQKYGLCIRDMDQESNYSGTEDLLLERSPASIVDSLGCSLDSWWEAKYSFSSEADGDFYYYPLNAAWENIGADGQDLAYCSGMHQLSGSDPEMLSYSVPLIDDDGYPYGVIGVEISAKHFSSLLPNAEINEKDKCCYILCQQETDSGDCVPLVGTGALYSRCFGGAETVSCGSATPAGGFELVGREGTKLYGCSAQLDIYNNNNPFENRQLTLLAIVERDTLFAYISRVKLTLLIVALISLILGIAGILMVSRRFAAPITALAKRVRGMETQPDFQLDRLGIDEIDQLVDSIEELNRNISRNVARTEFFSRMSHDMRTPMNAIISFSSPEMLEGSDEAVKADYLDKIHASGEYLLGLINEVLDMTKIESSKTQLHLETVTAGSLFETTIPIIEKLAQKGGVRFATDVSLDSDAHVLADRQHIDQIVINLLSNAVKFTPSGGTVKLAASMSENYLCRIVVSDTGCGMSEDFMKKLYTPFEQENSRKDGTGLGLSIAKKLVELMGGTIECESRQNAGTTFTVELPLEQGASEITADTNEKISEAVDLTVLRGKNILVFEDNGINARIIRNLLEKHGITVTIAEDGQAGLEVFTAAALDTYDAILMDIQMPVMNGLEATRALRALERTDAGTIPIIAMTANAFESDAQASRAAGMNAHLAKPVDPTLLYATLVRLLKK